MTARPTFTLTDVAFYERDVVFRMPFKFGVVTLTAAPQTFVSVQLTFADGTIAQGLTAEILAPKWFDKSPDLTNEDNFDQLRRAVAMAAKAYGAVGTGTAFGLHAAAAPAIEAAAKAAGLPPLVASFGAAQMDKAILDALARHHGVSIFEAARTNLFDLSAALTPDLDGFDIDAFLAGLTPQPIIAARHTVGMVDPITAADIEDGARVGDGLPETLEEVIAATGIDHFKLKVGGNVEADIARLSAIAGVLDALPQYRATLDGNEQYATVDGIAALWDAMEETPALDRLRDSILFIEQPIARSKAFSEDVSSLSSRKAIEIDESDGTLDAFLEAKGLGYQGVSSKSCKGIYKALLNRARCETWNAAEGTDRYFMSAEDLTTQAGLAVQQDLALATLIGCTHVERNGHHYVNGLSAVPRHEQEAFLSAHGDLYEDSHGAVRVSIKDGRIGIGSLDGPGFATGATPDLQAMRRCHYTP
ncbi:MAG: mandelate racemase [Devosia sp.]